MTPIFGPKKTLTNMPAVDPILIRQRTNILVIDDDPSAFPVRQFQQIGYTITDWRKVENLQRLFDHTYDIVILDVMGVADDFGGDGLDVLKLIKKNAPSQLVIAFSGSKAVQSKEEFWKTADGSLKKPIGFFDCQNYLDEFIDKHITLNSKWTRLRDELAKGGISTKEINKIESGIIKSIEGDGSGVSAIKQLLSGNSMIKADSILGIVNSLVQLFGTK